MMKKRWFLNVVVGVLALISTTYAEDRLRLISEKAAITLGFRDASLPFSYLSETQAPIGYSMDICHGIVKAIEKNVGKSLNVELVPVTSSTRMPLMANGTIDLECGSTSNTLARQKQVSFAPTTFVVANHKKKPWLTRTTRFIGKKIGIRNTPSHSQKKPRPSSTTSRVANNDPNSLATHTATNDHAKNEYTVNNPTNSDHINTEPLYRQKEFNELIRPQLQKSILKKHSKETTTQNTRPPKKVRLDVPPSSPTPSVTQLDTQRPSPKPFVAKIDIQQPSSIPFVAKLNTQQPSPKPFVAKPDTQEPLPKPFVAKSNALPNRAEDEAIKNKIQEILNTPINAFITQQEAAIRNHPNTQDRAKINFTIVYDTINSLPNKHAALAIDCYEISDAFFQNLTNPKKAAPIKDATLVMLYNELVRGKIEIFGETATAKWNSHPLLQTIEYLRALIIEEVEKKIPPKIINEAIHLPDKGHETSDLSDKDIAYFVLNRRPHRTEIDDINLIIKVLTPKDFDGYDTLSDNLIKDGVSKIVEASLSKNRREIIFNRLNKTLTNYAAAQKTLNLDAPMETPTEALQIRILNLQTRCLSDAKTSPISSWYLPRSKSPLSVNFSPGFLKRIRTSFYQFFRDRIFNTICFFLPGKAAKKVRANYKTRELLKASYLPHASAKHELTPPHLSAGRNFIQAYQTIQPNPSTQTYEKELEALSARLEKEMDPYFASLSDEALDRAAEKLATLRRYFSEVIAEYFPPIGMDRFKELDILKKPTAHGKNAFDSIDLYNYKLANSFLSAYKNSIQKQSIRRAGADLGQLISRLFTHQDFLHLLNHKNLPLLFKNNNADPIQKRLTPISVEIANGIVSRDLLFRPIGDAHSPEKEIKVLIEAGMNRLNHPARKILKPLLEEKGQKKLATLLKLTYAASTLQVAAKRQ